MKFVITTFLALLFMGSVLTFLSSCGKADGMTTGQMVPAPPGYVCFAIMQNGEPHGGNCIKE